MKITDVKTILLTGPSTLDPYILKAKKYRSVAFVEIHTDTEYMGIGETYGGYFCPELIPAAVEFYKPILVGQNVDDVDELWRRMYRCGSFWGRVGFGAIVINAIEAALWDLKGKLLNKPVHALLGGSQYSKLLAYATGGPSNYPKKELANKVDFYLGLGFKGLKLGACYFDGKGWGMTDGRKDIVEFEADKIQFVRQHVGADVKILMDAHMDNPPVSTWDLQTAKAVLKALEPYDIFLFEEPLPYTDPWGYAELRSSTTIPVAGGECLTAEYEWRVFAEKNSFAIAQPDASFVGGLSVFMRVAKMFEKDGGKVATHSWGAGGSLMQNIHCAFAASNMAIVEIPPNFGPLHSEIIRDSFQMKDGYVLPPQTPGLGITLSDEIKQKYPFVPGTGEFNSVPGKILNS